MSINLNSIRDILNVKDDNISFSNNFYLKKKFRYVDSHFFYASLSYVPSACPCCGSSFMDESSFVDPYCNLSNDLKNSILLDLMEVYSLKSIAKRWHVSPSTVLRVLDSVPPLKNNFLLFLSLFVWMSLSRFRVLILI